VNEIHEELSDQATFRVVYIREAHPADSPRARPGWSKVNDPTTLEERIDVARQCAAEVELKVPFTVDDIDDPTARAYDAHPDRLYVIAPDGKIAYRGARGPRGFDVDEMRKALLKTLEEEDREYW